MYTTSTAYKTEIQKRSRTFECRVTIGDRVFTNNEVQSIDLNCGIQDVFSIGNTPSMCLELVLRNTTDTIFTTNSVNVEIGLKIGNTIEYIPLGIFNIEDIKKDDYTTKFTCYDNMTKFEIAYFSSLGDKPTLQQVVNELASKTGVQFTGTLPAYNVKKLEGFTCREVLGYVASLCGGNALITRDGNFTIVYPTDISRDVGEGVFDLQRDEVKYKVGKITCQVKEQETISKGSLGTDNMELSFENPWVTETILTDIYNRLNGFNYLGYTMKWQGDLSLDIGDIITYTDAKKVTRKLPILYRKLSYDGGLDSELSAKGETKNKNSFNSSGSMSNKVNRLVTEQAIIKEAIIEKANISDLKATNAEIANLKVKDTEIENALIKKATIEQLNAANANIQNLIAEDARINNLVASKASITELNAVSAKIGTVEADTAIIKDLLAGNVTAGSGQIIHLTAKNVTIEDAVIKNLIATKLSVADLMAGTINTNKFTIASTDGGLNIVGPTIQWKDKNNKIRMQAGKDAQGNFTFLLVGEDGTTALLDQTGIKKGAIANDLIVSDMISENAIGEKQINYSSLITGLNKDDNTSLIKASKVAIDLTGQSLEVAFNSLKSNVNDMENITQNLQTQITANNGKIEALIKDTTITEGSSSTSLKDAYISLKATVNGLNSTVASHTSSISTVTTELGKVDGKINTAKADAVSTAGADATSKANNALNSAKSYTNAQITTVNTRVSNAESSITQLNNSITNKVWQTDINKAVSTITPDVTYAKDYVEALENNKGYRYKHDVIVYGDSDKYYPVIIKGGNQWVRRKIVVSRSYGEQAPNDWNNATHKGALNVVIDTNFGGWGGTQYSWSIYALSQTYANTFAGCMNCGANVMFAIFLRGGGETGALYHLYSDQSLVTNIYNKLPDGTVLPAPQIAYNKDLIFYSPKSDGTAYEYYAPPARTLTKEVLEEIQSGLFIDNANQARKDIATITTEVTTVKEKAATLETNLNGITSKVTNLESTTSTINGKVNAQETRLQSTEQKVTATGVITTITEAINAGTNSLTTMQFILDKNGATIKNGRFVSKDSSGKKKYELDGQALKLYDYKATSDRVAGAIESREMVSDSSVVGMSLLCRDNKWISIDYIGSSNDDITQETSHAYMRFSNPNDLYKRQIEFFKRLHLNGNSISFSQQTGGHDSYFKANGYQLLSYLPNPSSTINRDYASWIIANNVTGEDHIVLMPRQMEIYPYIWNQGGIYTAGSISSAKIATQDVSTFSYGVRSLNSYQTADALVSDFGEGVINEDGECIVFLDEVFKELVNTNCTYRVILTAYDENEEFTSIDLKCIKKNSEYFTVKSNCIGLKFDWSIVAKEKEEEMTRLADTKLTRDLYLDVKVSDLLNAEESTKSKDIVKELTEQSLQNLEIINNEDVFLKELEIKNESILSEIERDGLNE
ncbi:hypothetical protein [Clostridium paraputrificum]|uniref:hypothetical protein n=1 Tax=Clostridium paraputrificum TaxID=29363 RepID=UPI000C07FEDF|nr:hypothetical protein [Clostridium paraputrificum]